MHTAALVPHAFALLSVLGVQSAATQPKPTPTMKAVRIHAFGGPDVLAYEDAARPEVKPGEVLVRVHAAGVNPIDWKVREGHLRGVNPTLPQILGFDVAGVVEQVGNGVERFQAGNAVFGCLALTRGGGYAEYVVVPEADLARKPKSLDQVKAAAVPLAALTAWQAFDAAGLKAGQTVLIHGGAGGVGHFAIQIAKARGARVIATASTNNQGFLKELGADFAIDYTTAKFEDLVQDVDVVLDSIGKDTQQRSLGVLKKGGYLVSIVGAPDPKALAERGLRGRGILVQPSGQQLAEIATLIDSGKVKPHVSETIPLSDVKRAHALSEGGHTRGKIVLQVVR